MWSFCRSRASIRRLLGYQPTGQFAPTSRFGSPADFALLVEACHSRRAGRHSRLGSRTLPRRQPRFLARFDGTALYEHADPRQGRHLDWGTLIYKLWTDRGRQFSGRQCTVLARALWHRRAASRCGRLHALSRLQPSGGRLDCEPAGRRENLEAVAFLKRFNAEAFAHCPGTTTIAEESTAWPMVTRPVHDGGLGFGYNGIWAG